MADNINTLLDRFTQQEEAAKAANIQRYQQAMTIYDEIIARYRPGGEFGKAALGQLEKRKVLDVGKETQQLISSGLYGTTTMGATGRRWEEAVGAPERLRLEDIQMQRLSQAQVGKAGFIERREDVGPDYSQIAGLTSQIGAAPQPQTIRTTKKGPSPWEAGFLGGGFTLGEGAIRAPGAGGTGGTVKGLGPLPGGGAPVVEEKTAEEKAAAGGETIRRNTTFGRWAVQLGGATEGSRVGGAELGSLKTGFKEYLRRQRGGDIYAQQTGYKG